MGEGEWDERKKGSGAAAAEGRKTVSVSVWVRCGPRSTDSSPELCPGRSRKIYNADVFSRGVSLLDSYGFLSSSAAGSTKDGQEDEDGTEKERRGGEAGVEPNHRR